MKKNSNKKLFTGIAVLALSGTMVLGAAGLAACGPVVRTDNNERTSGAVAIDTAVGVAYSQSSGKKYYVSPDGNNATAAPDDINKPYSFDALNNDETNGIKPVIELAPGDTVYVLPGTYKLDRRVILTSNGAYNNYIAIVNAAYAEGSGYTGTETRVTLDFSAHALADSNRGVQIYGSYYYWYGVDVCGAGDNGLFIAGNFNTIEYSEFYNNRDTGLQLGRSNSGQTQIRDWPSYNLIKNCTSHNNYDNESTKGENADGFAAKLTIGYGNVFDGCIAYRNSDDGWDLYAYASNGNIGTVVMYNCVAYENGFLEYTQAENHARYPQFLTATAEENTNSYYTQLGDGNGFKLGGSVMEGDVKMYNCLSFNNRMHGVTDNSNPGFLKIEGVTSYDNGAVVDDNPASATFGHVISAANSDSYGNIDVARQNYSYNSLINVLSVQAIGKGLNNDAYRGSVTNSLLYAGSKTNVVKGSVDADTKTGASTYTSQVDALVAADLFETLPIVNSEDGYTINASGKHDFGTSTNGVVSEPNAERAHLKYRNADNSINMGDILAIKEDYDFTALLGEGVKVGSYLNGTSWEDYTHFVNEDVMDSATSAEMATVLKAADVLTVNADENAVYQDFDVATNMNGDVTVAWSSDNEEYLEVGVEENVNEINGARFTTVYVYRPSDEDKTVTLTATLTCGSASVTKDFTLVIKKGNPSVGTIYLITEQGETIYNGGSYIVDQYRKFSEPLVNVENGLDYNGKLLRESQYTVDYTYYYAKDKNAHAVEVKGFTPSNAGVYTVTVTASLTGEVKGSGSMTYTIYVASAAANVDFSGTPSIVVNRDGYNISGNLSSATGTLYAVSSVSELTDLSVDNIKEYEGVAAYDFRGDFISFQFANSNEKSYYIYYALGNVNGDITSKLYRTQVLTVDIDNTADFIKIAGGGKIGSEISTTTIYMLTKDLDFAGVSYSVGNSSFTALLNGQGHTVSNITTSGTSVIYKLSGGTIENIKFKNITINSSENKVGVIGEISGGFVHNVQVLGANIAGAQRVGALAGAASESAVPTYISQVYVDSETSVTSGSTRAGGIIGHFQSTSAPVYTAEIYISDCLVEADIVGGGAGVGGIVGEYDPNKLLVAEDCYLEIVNCVFTGSAWSKQGTASNKTAGMVGDQKGSATLVIRGCLSIGTRWYGVDEANKTEIVEDSKNSSPMVGGSTADTTGKVTVSNSVAYYQEHYFDVIQYSQSQLEGSDGVVTFTSLMGFDVTEKWTLIYAEGGDTLVSPYLTLNFLG